MEMAPKTDWCVEDIHPKILILQIRRWEIEKLEAVIKTLIDKGEVCDKRTMHRFDFFHHSRYHWCYECDIRQELRHAWGSHLWFGLYQKLAEHIHARKENIDEVITQMLECTTHLSMNNLTILQIRRWEIENLEKMIKGKTELFTRDDSTQTMFLSLLHDIQRRKEGMLDKQDQEQGFEAMRMHTVQENDILQNAREEVEALERMISEMKQTVSSETGRNHTKISTFTSLLEKIEERKQELEEQEREHKFEITFCGSQKEDVLQGRKWEVEILQRDIKTRRGKLQYFEKTLLKNYHVSSKPDIAKMIDALLTNVIQKRKKEIQEKETQNLHAQLENQRQIKDLVEVKTQEIKRLRKIMGTS